MIIPPSFNFKGDSKKAQLIKGQALQFYNHEITQMEREGLPDITRTKMLPDGSIISFRATKQSNYNSIRGNVTIYSPPVIGEEIKSKGFSPYVQVRMSRSENEYPHTAIYSNWAYSYKKGQYVDVSKFFAGRYPPSIYSNPVDYTNLVFGSPEVFNEYADESATNSRKNLTVEEICTSWRFTSAGDIINFQGAQSLQGLWNSNTIPSSAGYIAYLANKYSLTGRIVLDTKLINNRYLVTVCGSPGKSIRGYYFFAPNVFITVIDTSVVHEEKPYDYYYNPETEQYDIPFERFLRYVEASQTGMTFYALDPLDFWAGPTGSTSLGWDWPDDESVGTTYAILDAKFNNEGSEVRFLFYQSRSYTPDGFDPNSAIQCNVKTVSCSLVLDPENGPEGSYGFYVDNPVIVDTDTNDFPSLTKTLNRSLDIAADGVPSSFYYTSANAGYLAYSTEVINGNFYSYPLPTPLTGTLDEVVAEVNAPYPLAYELGEFGTVTLTDNGYYGPGMSGGHWECVWTPLSFVWDSSIPLFTGGYYTLQYYDSLGNPVGAYKVIYLIPWGLRGVVSYYDYTAISKELYESNNSKLRVKMTVSSENEWDYIYLKYTNGSLGWVENTTSKCLLSVIYPHLGNAPSQATVQASSVAIRDEITSYLTNYHIMTGSSIGNGVLYAALFDSSGIELCKVSGLEYNGTNIDQVSSSIKISQELKPPEQYGGRVAKIDCTLTTPEYPSDLVNGLSFFPLGTYVTNFVGSIYDTQSVYVKEITNKIYRTENTVDGKRTRYRHKTYISPTIQKDGTHTKALTPDAQDYGDSAQAAIGHFLALAEDGAPWNGGRYLPYTNNSKTLSTTSAFEGYDYPSFMYEIGEGVFLCSLYYPYYKGWDPYAFNHIWLVNASLVELAQIELLPKFTYDWAGGLTQIDLKNYRDWERYTNKVYVGLAH